VDGERKIATRNIGFIHDRNSYRREDDDYPYGECLYKPDENSAFYRGMHEANFQLRRVYLDEYATKP